MISVENISKSYGKLKALDNISLQFAKGQSIALIGPNGSGKSTLMKCLLGLVFADRGKILIDGKEIKTSFDYRKQIGYMPQIVKFPDNISVNHLFSMIRDIRKEKQFPDMELVRDFEIEKFQNKTLGSLSGGMKQKVNAALAFMFDPGILILDEPTAGLDPLSSEILKTKILKEKEKGKLIIISSHIMADLEEIATDVLYLIDGHAEFFKSTDKLMEETNSRNLSKAIAQVMIEQNITV